MWEREPYCRSACVRVRVLYITSHGPLYTKGHVTFSHIPLTHSPLGRAWVKERRMGENAIKSNTPPIPDHGAENKIILPLD